MGYALYFIAFNSNRVQNMVKFNLTLLFSVFASAATVLGSPLVNSPGMALTKRAGCAYDPVTDSFTGCVGSFIDHPLHYC